MNSKVIYLLIVMLVFTELVNAQYFGRNKVQYEQFNFRTLNTEFFNIYYYPEEANAAYDAAYMLERWNLRYAKIFGKPVTKGQPIILYASHGHFQQTNVVSGAISQGTGGVTEGLKNRITLPFTGSYAENDHVIGHELVHAFQYEIFKNAKGGLNNAGQVPLWFIEGLAEYLSVGRRDAFTAMWMRDAVLNDDVPTIDQVSRGYNYFPYRYGHAIWTYIAGRWGDEIIAPLFKATADSGWNRAFKFILNTTIDSLSADWQKAIKTTYQPQIEGKTKPDSIGKVVRNKKDVTNLSPVISPDGKYISLITSESLFTLDLYLIDAASGEAITQLASSNTDRHFDALRFINSSGSWSPDSRSFALVVIEEGEDQIAIVDVPSGKFKREIRIDSVNEISHISWSPDGEKLLISGLSGGISNLYLYNLTTGISEKLTDDKYADLQPDWSPDGKTIVFASDREDGNKPDQLNYSNLKIAFMDISSGNIKLVSISDQAKNINPVFSPDGNDIYFISDPDGYSNIYKYNLHSGSFTKITDAATGISGLTETSPAISISRTGELAFTVFDKGRFLVNSMQTNNSSTAGEDTASNYDSTAALPPVNKSGEGIVQSYLADTKFPLYADTSFRDTDYTASLGLVYVGQPYAGVQVSSFGTTFGGGVSFYFGDILGNHFLGSALQISGTLKDIGGEVFYLNQEHRLGWGGGIAHEPYLSGYTYGRYDTVSVGGNLYLGEEYNIVRQRVFVDQASLISQYPFSTNRRIEFSLGYTRYSYDVEVQTYVMVGSQVISDETRELDSPPGLNLFQASVAYVGDYSFFGFTSPIDGSRYRFEAEPTLGSLNFVSFLADYRQYFFFNPVTIAIRGLHYGRYFGDADDNRLSPLQLGFDTWIRGYNLSSFEVEEFSNPQNPDKSPEIDRLLGSKVGILNFEVRLPLFGNGQFGIINLGFLPVELTGFIDAGVAWTNKEKPVFKIKERSDERIPVFSSGFSARINLFGYLAGEVYYAYPFQRPDRKWIWGFNLAPGW